MSVGRRAVVHAAVVAAAAALMSTSAWPQTAIKLIVPYPPAGGADVLARVLVYQISNMGGPTFAVEDRPGAGTEIGTGAAVRAVPAGKTLLLTNNAFLLVPHLRKVDYDPMTSLEPICNLGSTPSFGIVNSASPYRTLDDLIAAGRAKPGQLIFR